MNISVLCLGQPCTSGKPKLTRYFCWDLQLAGPDMLIDAYDQYTHDENEVVDIQPDGDSDSQENVLRADDCKYWALSAFHIG